MGSRDGASQVSNVQAGLTVEGRVVTRGGRGCCAGYCMCVCGGGDHLAYVGPNNIHDYLDRRYHSSVVPRGH